MNLRAISVHVNQSNEVVYNTNIYLITKYNGDIVHVSILPHTTVDCVDFANIVVTSHFVEVAQMASKFLGDDDLTVCAVKNHKITCAFLNDCKIK